MSHLPVSTLCTYGLPLRAYDHLALDVRPAERPEPPRSTAPPRPGPTRPRGLLRRAGLPRLVAGVR